jgi:hypothetical protein
MVELHSGFTTRSSFEGFAKIQATLDRSMERGAVLNGCSCKMTNINLILYVAGDEVAWTLSAPQHVSDVVVQVLQDASTELFAVPLILLMLHLCVGWPGNHHTCLPHEEFPPGLLTTMTLPCAAIMSYGLLGFFDRVHSLVPRS